MRSGDREQLQEGEYGFPYHYLPHRVAGGVSNLRYLRWGLEYACYLYHVAALVEELAPRSHLDVGCGDGRLFEAAAAPPGAARVGVDFSSRSLDYARAFHPEARFLSDLNRLAADETFELVSAVEVLEHVSDGEVAGFVAALAARVSPGGHLLLSVPSAVQRLHPKHYRHYDEALLRAQVGAGAPGLEAVRIDHVYRPSRVVDLYAKATLNRFVVLELAPLRRWAWRLVWTRLRRAAPGRGRHLVGLFRAGAYSPSASPREERQPSIRPAAPRVR